jgi:hypothetical protein
MRSLLSARRADLVAKELELDLDKGICHLCLSIVSFALDESPPSLHGKLRQMTPQLWVDGLAPQAFEAVRRACERGVPDADTALADLELNGGLSATARSIVRRLAVELDRRTRMELRLEELARDRLRRAPPQWN